MTASRTATQRRTPAPSGEAPPRVTKRRAETRAKLLDAAFHVFAHKGFGLVRIDDVCRAAGYTRGAFYSQFDNLEALFFTLYDERARLIAEQVTQALLPTNGTADLEGAIERISATLLLDRDWLLVKTDFLLHAARHPDVAERLADHRANLREAIECRLRSSQRDLSLPPTVDDVPKAARAVVAAYDGVTVQLLLDGDVEAARRWLTQLLGALLNR